ncbi:MAG TPA: NAD(P)-dependent alcohol dehydrogenase [Terracidiphilus sp.]|jgi:NADPH:quinone reductase-like Zn-dependent oxidoreductase
MKAIVRHKYGTADVLELENLPKPIPSEHELLIRVHAAALNPFDWHLMRGTPWFLRLFTGVRKPKNVRMGADVAGTVVGLGKGVTEFRLGDDVFGAADGSLAEYVCAPVAAVVRKPENVRHEEAAAVPIGGLTALQALRDKGHVKAGDSVLINGASGGVGVFAVQIAKWFGARVTGVCSERNLDLVRSVGADQVIDYTHEDFTAAGERYDVIFDLVGNRKLSDLRRVLKQKGVFIGCGGGGPETPGGRLLAGMLEQLIAGLFTKQKLVGVLAKRSKADLEVLSALLASGNLKPVIDRHFGLAEVPEAIRYVEQGHVRGKVVVQL